jgi:hypothetical protein
MDNRGLPPQTSNFDCLPGRAGGTPMGIKVTAHVDTASNQAITGTDRVYFMRVDGNKLVVKSPGVIVPTNGATSVVEFELVKA